MANIKIMYCEITRREYQNIAITFSINQFYVLKSRISIKNVENSKCAIFLYK